MSAIAEARRIYEAKLSAENAKAAGLEVYSVEQMEKIAGRDNARGRGAFEVPYPGMEGHSRFRFLGEPDPTIEVRTDKGKLVKPPRYWQRKGAANAVYVPPCVDREALLKDPSIPITWMEGELKAWASALLTGLPCLAIGGVRNFIARKGSPDPAVGMEPFFPHPHRIMFDSYRKPNENVNKARAAFRELLRKHGARVEYVRDLPIPKGAKEEKPDDYAMRTSGEALRRHVEGEAQATPLERVRDGHQPITLNELLDLNPPEPKWMVPGLIQAETAGLIVGTPNVGKTLWAYYLAIEAAKLGFRVLIYQNEGSLFAMKKRLDRAQLAGPLTHAARDLIGLFHNSGSLDDDGTNKILDAAQAHQSQLIFLDSLNSMARDVDENSAKEWGAVFNRIYRIKTETGASPYALHHFVKESWVGSKAPTLADVRGSGAAGGRIDVVYGLKQRPTECNSDRVSANLYDLKQRDAPLHDPRILRIAMRGAAATVEMADDKVKGQTGTNDLLAEAQAKVLPHVPHKLRADGVPTGKGTSAVKLRAALNLNRGDVGEMVKALIGAGLVVREKQHLVQPGKPGAALKLVGE